MRTFFELIFGDPMRPAKGLRLLLDALGHRAELAGVEMAEARAELAKTAVFLAVSAGLSLLAATLFTAAFAAAVWQTSYRIPALLALASAYAIGAVGFFVAARRRLRGWQPFGEISAQLRKDAQCLETITAAR